MLISFITNVVPPHLTYLDMFMPCVKVIRFILDRFKATKQNDV